MYNKNAHSFEEEIKGAIQKNATPPTSHCAPFRRSSTKSIEASFSQTIGTLLAVGEATCPKDQWPLIRRVYLGRLNDLKRDVLAVLDEGEAGK
jgi:hypothetical protein